MKHIRFLPVVLAMAALALGACSAAAVTPTSAPAAATVAKVDAMPVSFVGIVDSIAGDQWVISGTTVTVDAAAVHDGPFSAGDRIKVEGLVEADGSLTVSRVESSDAEETATATPEGDANANDEIGDDNGNDANINDDNGNDANINDDNGNDANINDDNGNDANINDDNGNDANINDDNGNDANTNDDNTNSGGGSGGGGNDNGGDDSGGHGGGG